MANPSGPLQAIPPGLLSLFQLKNLGRNPGELDGTLVPVVDLLDWYLLGQAIDLFGISRTLDGATDVPGFIGWTTPFAVVVPATEWWWVSWYSISVAQPTSNDDCALSPAVLLPSQPQQVQLFDNTAPQQVATYGRVACGVRGFWLPPGSTLGFWLSNIAATNALQVGASLHYTPLRI